jgi:hypothetical protein
LFAPFVFLVLVFPRWFAARSGSVVWPQNDPISHCRDSQRELHMNAVNLWAGLRSSILSTRFAAKASQC